MFIHFLQHEEHLYLLIMVFKSAYDDILFKIVFSLIEAIELPYHISPEDIKSTLNTCTLDNVQINRSLCTQIKSYQQQ